MTNVMICDSEKNFFRYLLEIKPNQTVLEWGSGNSTIAIAKRVKQLVSVESDIIWFNTVTNMLKAEKLTNVSLHHIPIANVLSGNRDGTLDECFDYVNFPKDLNLKFDLIFIDGRARIECAKVASKLLNPNGNILIHDYPVTPDSDRQEYREVEKFLDSIAYSNMLRLFKVKD